MNTYRQPRAAHSPPRLLKLATTMWFLALLVVGGTHVGARQDAAAPTPSPEGLPEGDGRLVTAKVCGVCHEARRAASVRLSQDGWSTLIDDMVRRGAKGSDEELNQVLEYLSTHFLGEAPRPININSAPQIDFETVLGLLRREAAAVIAYRDKNGRFNAVEDLKKVPGLDYKKVADKLDRVVAF